MFRIFGRDPALGIPNLQGQAELYTPQSTKQLFDVVSRAVSSGIPYELELLTVQPDGEQRPCFVKGFPERDGSNRVIRLAGLVQDITQRKREEEKTRLAASVFSHAREGITITDADGVILDVNEAFTRITGYSREEALGQNPRILKSGRHDKAFYEAMWRDLTGMGHWSGEVWNRRKDGEVYAELLTISAVCDAQGKPSYSRPRVSGDNAYAESLFRTAKYRPEFPTKGFGTLQAAREWGAAFVHWYNLEHKHSGTHSGVLV